MSRQPFFQRFFAQEETPKKDLHTERDTSSSTIISGQIFTEEYNADLTGLAGLKIYDQMRRGNATVSEAIDLTTLPLIGAKWFVMPASEDEADIEIKDFVEKALFEHLNMPWESFIRQALEEVVFGFSLFEKVFVPLTVNGEELLGINFFPISQFTVESWETSDKEPGIRQVTVTGHQADVLEKDLLRFTFRQNGDNFYGISILRAAYTHWYYVDSFFRVQAISHERHGVGIPILTTPNNAEADDKTAAEAVVQNIRANEKQYASFPEGFKLEMMDMRGTQLNDMQPSIEYHTLQIAHAALVAFAFSGSTPNGSRATTVSLSDMFLKSLKAIGNQITGEIDKIIQDLVDINFPGVKEYPHLKFTELEREDVSQLSTTLERFARAGLITPTTATEEHLRGLLDLPIEENANPTVEVQSEKNEEMSDVATANRKLKAFEFVGDRYFRPLTAAEEKVDLAGIDRRLNLTEDSLVQQLSQLSDQQIQLIIQQINLAAQSDDPAAALQNIIIPLQDQYNDIIDSELRGVFETAKVTTADEMAIDAPVTTQDEVNKLNLKSAAVKDDHINTLKTAATLAGATAIAQGLSPSEITNTLSAQLKDTIESKIINFANVGPTEALNQGRRFTQKLNLDLIYGFQYSAILDDRVCNTCLALDGKVVAANSQEYDAFNPPQHFNCRCIWVEILFDEEDKPPITGIPEEIPEDLNVSTFRQLTNDQVKRLADPDSFIESRT